MTTPTHLTYLASPYSHRDPVVRWQRHEAAVKAQAALFGRGEMVYSPIAQCAESAEKHGMPTDWQFWAAFDRRMLAACDSITVLMIPGWEESVGVRAEVGIAQDLGLPVRYIDEDGTEERCER